MSHKKINLPDMRTIISLEEEKVAKDLTHLAFAKAADSFSKFANKFFTIHSTSLHITKELPPLRNEIASIQDYVLISGIVGEIKGESYLIFTSEQARELVNDCLPPEMAKKEEMFKAILLEVDNILTASMVTQFSDYFESQMYGDVPKLNILTPEETEELIQHKSSHYQVILSMKATFHSASVNIKPEFIWVFTPEFIEAIKKLCTNQSALDKISNLQGFVDEFLKK